MRELDLLIRGIIAGLIIAVPVGPVNVLCINRTLSGGWRSGLICGVAAATADMLYGAIAGYSITLVIQFLIKEQFWIRVIGAFILMGIGISYLLKPAGHLERQNQEDSSVLSNLRSTFLLTLTNPTTVLSFLVVLAALGIGGGHRPGWLTLFLVLGIFSGSMLWWTVLTSIVNHFRQRFDDPVMRWMNKIAGIAIGGFGIVTLVLSHR